MTENSFPITSRIFPPCCYCIPYSNESYWLQFKSHVWNGQTSTKRMNPNTVFSTSVVIVESNSIFSSKIFS